MGVFVSDALDDTDGVKLQNHTGATGASWTQQSGGSCELEFDSNRIKTDSGCAGNNSCHYYASGVPSGVEYDVEGPIRSVSTRSAWSAIGGRVSTTAKTGYFAQYNSQSSRWELDKVVSGTVTDLGTFTGDHPTSAAKTAKLEIKDATKKLFIDDVERISSADNEITDAGRVGMRGFNDMGAGQGNQVESITGTEADAGGSLPALDEGHMTGGLQPLSGGLG